jgi:hypothetical protein
MVDKEPPPGDDCRIGNNQEANDDSVRRYDSKM